MIHPFVTYAQQPINIHQTQHLFIIKPCWSYMFWLVLSYPQAVWDCIKTKCTITISQLSPTLFWDVMQCMLVAVYDVSGQPICPIFKGQVVHEEWLLGLLDPCSWDHKAVLKSWSTITDINCVTSYKSEGFNYNVVGALNLSLFFWSCGP